MFSDQSRHLMTEVDRLRALKIEPHQLLVLADNPQFDHGFVVHACGKYRLHRYRPTKLGETLAGGVLSDDANQ